MFEFIVTLPIWKALSETEYKILRTQIWLKNWDMTENNVKWKSKLFYVQNLVMEKCWRCKNQFEF